MDGLKDTVSLGKPYEEFHQMSFFDLLTPQAEEKEEVALPCLIKDWRANEAVLFKDCKGER